MDGAACREYVMAELTATVRAREEELLEFSRQRLRNAADNATARVFEESVRVPDIAPSVKHLLANQSEAADSLCPWGTAQPTLRIGAEAAGRWVPTEEEEEHLYFTPRERRALRGELRGKCLPDGAGRGAYRWSSLRPLALHWSGCEGEKACTGVLGLARWMVAAGSSSRRLLFVGDSITEQRFDAAICDLARSGCQKLGPRKFAQPYPKLYPHFNMFEENYSCDGGAVNVTLTLQDFPTWSRFAAADKDIGRAQGGYRDAFIDQLRSLAIAVVNVGLHGTGGIDDLAALLANFARESRGRRGSARVLWAETTSQHFDAPHGVFQRHRFCNVSRPEACGPMAGLCVPIRKAGVDAAQNADYFNSFHANDVAAQAFGQAGVAGVVPIVHMEALTHGRWDMHVDPSWRDWSLNKGSFRFRDDCTHFLYSPTFYAPVWRAILDALLRDAEQ